MMTLIQKTKPELFKLKTAGLAVFMAIACYARIAVCQNSATNSLPIETGSATNSVRKFNQNLLNGYVPDDRYKLRVGDIISFQIIEDKDAPKSLVVMDSGEMNVPYIGRVTVADKTCKQLAEELKKQLEKDYYYRATVIISLDTANKVLGRVYVWGQVKAQGPVDINVGENLTVGKAILKAGGFGDFANKGKVKLVRGGGADGTQKTVIELDMNQIFDEGKTEKDVVLKPDDSIIIPARLINF